MTRKEAREKFIGLIELKEKLKNLEKNHARMVYINKVHRAFKKSPASLDNVDLPETAKNMIRNYVPQYSWEPSPYPPYALQNSKGNIGNVKKRIAELENAANRIDVKEKYDGFTYLEEDNRHQFLFDGKLRIDRLNPYRRGEYLNIKFDGEHLYRGCVLIN